MEMDADEPHSHSEGSVPVRTLTPPTSITGGFPFPNPELRFLAISLSPAPFTPFRPFISRCARHGPIPI